jgi:hypothetical protein
LDILVCYFNPKILVLLRNQGTINDVLLFTEYIFTKTKIIY